MKDGNEMMETVARWGNAAKEAWAFELGDAPFRTSFRNNRFTFSLGASQKKWGGGEAKEGMVLRSRTDVWLIKDP